MNLSSTGVVEGVGAWWEVACEYGADNFLRNGGLKQEPQGI